MRHRIEVADGSHCDVTWRSICDLCAMSQPGRIHVPLRHSFRDVAATFISYWGSTRIRTRSNSSLVQAPSSTQKCAQAIRCTGPKIWNSLPNDIRFLPAANNPSPVLIPVKLKPFVMKMKRIEFHC